MENLNTVYSILKAFPTEQSCREHLEKQFWSGNTCPFGCTDIKIYKYKDGKILRCSGCKKNFTVTKGTIFEKTRIPLQKWFLAIHFLTSDRKGISSHQLARELEITQPNAWHLLHRLRKVMTNSDKYKRLMNGTVELDETYVGGKNKNKHFKKRKKGTQGRSLVDKSVVYGLMERGGFVRVFHIKNLSKKGMQAIVRVMVKKGASIMTDEYVNYKGLNQIYNHQTVNHGQYQYVDGNCHTNTIEGFWSYFKRGILGTYHSTSKKYLKMYGQEFAFRYNSRKESLGTQFTNILNQSLGCCLTKKDLIG